MKLLSNLGKVLSKPSSLIGVMFGALFLISINIYFLDIVLVIGNLGLTFLITQIVLDFFISLLFGLFIGSTIYKIKYFETNKKTTSIGIFGSSIGILVSGCPACSITLASYLGLVSIISVFPYYGLELKAVSLILLLFVNYNILKNLESCKIKKKNKPFG